MGMVEVDVSDKPVEDLVIIKAEAVFSDPVEDALLASAD